MLLAIFFGLILSFLLMWLFVLILLLVVFVVVAAVDSVVFSGVLLILVYLPPFHLLGGGEVDDEGIRSLALLSHHTCYLPSQKELQLATLAFVTTLQL